MTAFLREPDEAGILLSYLGGEVVQLREPCWQIICKVLEAFQRAK